MTEDTPPSLTSRRSIQEFWIDFLLEEEFSVDDRFLSLFLEGCGFAYDDPAVVEVHHSVADRYGEADLVVIFTHRDNSGDVALLIEDKINASFQPRQAERYRLRGADGMEMALWRAFHTVLVAPKAYIRSGHGFDAAIPLEDISGWICEHDPRRRDFRRMRLEAAITKKNATGVQKIDQIMTAFRGRMFEYVQQYNLTHGTRFIPEGPRSAYHDDNWFILGDPALPKKSEFRYLSRTGLAQLWFKNVPASALNAVLKRLPADILLLAKGKKGTHATLQIKIDPILDFGDFERAKPVVDNAFYALRKLSDLFEIEREEISTAIMAARGFS